MNNRFSFPTIISLFQSVQEHLHNRNLKLALSQLRSILACDPNNCYALAIERRIMHVLDLQQDPSTFADSTEYSIVRIIAALEHVCQMAVRVLIDLSVQTPSLFDSNQLT